MRPNNPSTGQDDSEGPDKWKVRVAGIGIVLGIAAFIGNILIPAIEPEPLRKATFSIFIILVSFAFLFVIAFIFRTLLDLQRTSIRRSSREYIGELLEGVFTYRFDPQRGGFYYGKVRNVVARVRTFQDLVLGFVKGMRKSDRNSLLTRVGHEVGSSFAEVLRNEVLPEQKIRYDVLSKEMLDLWYKYDYRAGFATFDFDGFDPVSVAGTIQIRGHALNYQRTNEDPILCSFFHGYLEGVLSYFSAHDIELKSTCHKGKHTVCQLKVVPKS